MAHSRASIGCALLCAVSILFAYPPASHSSEPVVRARVDSATATIGDVLELFLLLQSDERWSPLLPVAPPQLPVDGVVSSVEGQAGRAGEVGEWKMVQRWRLRIFQLGQHHLDAIPVSFLTDAGDTVVVLSNPLDISIVSVRQEGETGLRDIKPPFGIPGGLPLWLVAILGALLVVAAAMLIRWLVLRPRSDVPLMAPAQRVDYVREFARIEEMGLVGRGALKLHYSLLSETLRRFLQDRIGITAPDLTTSEINEELGHTLEGERVAAIAEFLTAADMVKFAKAQPRKEDSLGAPEVGKRIVRDIESLLKPALEDGVGEVASSAVRQSRPA